MLNPTLFSSQLLWTFTISRSLIEEGNTIVIPQGDIIVLSPIVRIVTWDLCCWKSCQLDLQSTENFYTAMEQKSKRLGQAVPCCSQQLAASSAKAKKLDLAPMEASHPSQQSPSSN
jgi:hypothetical protein